jgi:hypothetical protein
MRSATTFALAALLSASLTPVASRVDAAGPRPHTRTVGAAAVASGLAGRWLLNEGSGASAADSSGNGNQGTVDGATWVSGHAGSALRFNGTSDRVTVPSSSSLSPSSVTASAWVRADSSPGDWRVFLFKGVTDCLAASYALKSSGAGGLVFSISDGTTNVFSPDAGSGVWDGAWHLVTGTYDGAHVRLYVDGALVGATATTITIGYGLPDGDDLVIGHPVNACGQSSQFAGDIDEVQIWGRALSGAEILGLYDSSVDVRSVGVSPSLFYPVKDGYRDAVAIRGNLLERASVTIRVRDAAGHLVRSFGPRSEKGRYSVKWDGRRASGSLAPEGRFRVVSSFRDAAGNTRAVTSSVRISHKRLVWHSGTQTKDADRFSGVGATTYADVNTWACDWPHCLYLFGNLYDQYAFARYQFTVPKAAKYGSFRFFALGAVDPQGVTSGPATLSLMNWSTHQEDGLRRTGWSYAWYSTKVAGAGHVNSKGVVRTWVTAYGWDEGNWDVAKVKLTYRYAVLR